MSRLRVVILFGGRSVEREVSRISARTIAGALDPSRRRPAGGRPDGASFRLSAPAPTAGPSPRSSAARPRGAAQPEQAPCPPRSQASASYSVIHGTTGEDGFSALLGSQSPTSAPESPAPPSGMDKSVFKSLLRDAIFPPPVPASPRKGKGERGLRAAHQIFASPSSSALQRRLLRRRHQSKGLARSEPALDLAFR
jgi:D-alanine-D-alanine ligase-like ATP-grasp enzyme